jgi:hypothetical protein
VWLSVWKSHFGSEASLKGVRTLCGSSIQKSEHGHLCGSIKTHGLILLKVKITIRNNVDLPNGWLCNEAICLPSYSWIVAPAPWLARSSLSLFSFTWSTFAPRLSCHIFGQSPAIGHGMTDNGCGLPQVSALSTLWEI